ncbi:MAG: hypothetical protein WCH83_09420 [Alphaproteobacteria bacterium]|jgi:hypothetical protein
MDDATSSRSWFAAGRPLPQHRGGSSIDRPLLVARSRETLSDGQLFAAIFGVLVLIGLITWTITSLDSWFRLLRCFEAGHRHCMTLDMKAPTPLIPVRTPGSGR